MPNVWDCQRNMTKRKAAFPSSAHIPREEQSRTLEKLREPHYMLNYKLWKDHGSQIQEKSTPVVANKSLKWSTDFLNCGGSIRLYFCPHSAGTSQGPVHSLYTFSYSVMVQELGLHSCSMSRGQFFSAHTLMTSGLGWPTHTEVLELKAQGLAIERRQRETTGEIMPGPDYMAWVHESSGKNSSLPPLTPQDQRVCLCIAGRLASSFNTQLFLAGP